ncbi:MAG TPA: Xaa-Pro peptidase family protein [Synergistaceae bacterium]|nr:Xaa-Pro peptidase family protein [Synergistaceae bacterium]
MCRMEKLYKRMKELEIPAFFSAETSNIRYLSGFTGEEAYFLMAGNKPYMIADNRLVDAIAEECPGMQIARWRNPYPPLTKVIEELLARENITTLGVETHRISYKLFKMLENGLPSVEIKPISSVVEPLRFIKEPGEIENIRRAASFADKAFQEVLNFIRPGVTEREIACELEYALAKAGSQGTGFPTIIASGHHAAMPHATPSERKIQKGDCIVMDFGGRHNLYPSDMTRTVVVGKASEEQKKLYETVRRAQLAGLKTVRAGAPARAAHLEATRVIIEGGYKESCFTHGVGHGVGLEIHEAPSMNAASEAILKKNNVVTVEPGIYVPGQGGVRIEDTLAVTEGEPEILTLSSKELIEL